jgi:hypothetical protein
MSLVSSAVSSVIFPLGGELVVLFAFERVIVCLEVNVFTLCDVDLVEEPAEYTEDVVFTVLQALVRFVELVEYTDDLPNFPLLMLLFQERLEASWTSEIRENESLSKRLVCFDTALASDLSEDDAILHVTVTNYKDISFFQSERLLQK